MPTLTKANSTGRDGALFVVAFLRLAALLLRAELRCILLPESERRPFLGPSNLRSVINQSRQKFSLHPPSLRGRRGSPAQTIRRSCSAIRKAKAWPRPTSPHPLRATTPFMTAKTAGLRARPL
ncbi:hypothetical protein CC2G_011427 [Coprinopsis cinerea AmutBmut pab1-1]|nr:hypothetical protein CC2G_011427 [Coprinopsis cinerea AmutBmut pab1-1]